MEHVFVETNWLVGCLAPAHHKVTAAVELLEKAKNGEIRLYVPAICIAECRRPVLEKFQVKTESDRVRKFLLWAKSNGAIETVEEETVRVVLDKMQGLVKRDLDRFENTLKVLCTEAGVEVFHTQEEMWVRTTELSHLGLQPFDQAILGSILVKADHLQKQGLNRLAFCEADSDLQPWDKLGNTKESLATLYDELGIWVYGDFLMQSPEMPNSWPEKRTG